MMLYKASLVDASISAVEITRQRKKVVWFDDGNGNEIHELSKSPAYEYFESWDKAHLFLQANAIWRLHGARDRLLSAKEFYKKVERIRHEID